MLNSTQHEINPTHNDEMATIIIVGILTFTIRINTGSESFTARKIFAFQYFSFYEELKFHAQLSWPWEKFINLGPAYTYRAWWSNIFRKKIFSHPFQWSKPYEFKCQNISISLFFSEQKSMFWCSLRSNCICFCLRNKKNSHYDILLIELYCSLYFIWSEW